MRWCTCSSTAKGCGCASPRARTTRPLGYVYAEPAPGTLELTYEGGAVEGLTNIAFDGEAAFDTTSSYDGALSCVLVDL